MVGSALQLIQAIQAINPIVAAALIQGGITAGSALVSALTPNRQQELLEESLNERKALTQRLSRISRGEFTPSEIATANQSPALQTIAQSATSRGVTGAARQQLIARGQQAILGRQQAAALQSLSPALSAQEQLAGQFPQEDLSPFFDDLRGIAEAVALSRMLDNQQAQIGVGQGTSTGRNFSDTDVVMQDTVQFLVDGLRER